MARLTPNARFEFEQHSHLIRELATRISAQLQSAIAQRGQASLVVSGGSTPLPLFQALRTANIDWAKVVITLADDRWLPADHPDSNERLVREHLLQQQASAAQFIGLVNEQATPEQGLAQTEQALKALPQPLDVVILGMGNDGHTASLFPCAEQLSQGFNTPALCVAMQPTSAPYARISLSLSALLNAQQIYLHIVGAEKKAVLETALDNAERDVMPIRAVLAQHSVPVDVYWSQN